MEGTTAPPSLLAAAFGCTFEPGPGTLQSVDDHQVVRLQPGFDHPHAVQQAANRYAAVLDHVVLVHRQQILLPLIRADRPLVDQQRLVRLAEGNAHANEQAGREILLGVLENAAGAQRARVAIDLVVGEIEDAGVGEAVFVGHADLDRESLLLQDLGMQFLAGPEGQLLVLQQHVLVDVEIHVDGIGGDDRRQHGGIARPRLDQVALGDSRAADAAIDGGGDVGELQVQLGVADGGLGRLDRGPMNGQVRHVLLVFVLADRARGTQPLAARQVGLGLVGQRQQPRQLAFRPVQRRLVGTRIDFVQQVSLLHVLAVHEVHLHEITGHPCANFHLAHGLGLAGKLEIVGHFAGDRLADSHLRRRLLGRLGNLLPTTGPTKYEACDAGRSPAHSRGSLVHSLVPFCCCNTSPACQTEIINPMLLPAAAGTRNVKLSRMEMKPRRRVRNRPPSSPAGKYPGTGNNARSPLP